MTTATTDVQHLAHAWSLASSVHGTTTPNPAVGCVITVDDVVVGEGATQPPGGPHAEVEALTAAGSRARGATAYVTLEPCAHHGRTPPCTDALMAAGVSRVVVGHPDPDPAAAGGASQLEAAGVEVVLAPETWRATMAAHLEGFLTRVTSGRPHVTLKLAQTVDGHTVATDRGRWITGPAARRAVHRWRREVDAVLVGSGTVLADDPGLDVRDVAVGSAPQPRPVVFDGRLRTPPSAKVVARGALVVTAPGASPMDRRALERAGAEVVPVAAGSDGTGVDLAAALRVLGDHGLNAVLAEPGRQLADALLRSYLVDRLVRHVALTGTGGQPTPVGAVPDAHRWRIERTGDVGADLLVQHVRVPEAA